MLGKFSALCGEPKATQEQQRICNYFWAIAHDEDTPELFPLRLDAMGCGEGE